VTPKLYPTPTRLKLMRWIAGSPGVKHWHFAKPLTHDLATDRNVTVRVAELVAAGLAEIPPAEDGFTTSMVRLTEAGAEYLDTYGKNGAGT
jgi:hypothetical protein